MVLHIETMLHCTSMLHAVMQKTLVRSFVSLLEHEQKSFDADCNSPLSSVLTLFPAD